MKQFRASSQVSLHPPTPNLPPRSSGRLPCWDRRVNAWPFSLSPLQRGLDAPLRSAPGVPLLLAPATRSAYPRSRSLRRRWRLGSARNGGTSRFHSPRGCAKRRLSPRGASVSAGESSEIRVWVA